MSAVLDELEHIDSTNGSYVLRDFTTMPSSNMHVRNMGRMHPPHPRPTVSLDPRPVVIPILSSVIGFPILVFALICALRHRAIKLRRRDHLKKLQSGVRSVTLDLPPRERISFFSGGSSPEISIKEAGEKLESGIPVPFVGGGAGLTSPTAVSGGPKSSILQTSSRRTNNPSSRNNNHVKFVTPATTLDPSHTMKVEVVLHTIATRAAESIGAEIDPPVRQIQNGVEPDSPERQIRNGVELDSPVELTPNGLEVDSPVRLIVNGVELDTPYRDLESGVELDSPVRHIENGIESDSSRSESPR